MSYAIPTDNTSEIVIRTASADDATVIARVAGRDSNGIPAYPALVAEVNSQIRAAISLSDGTAVADPFHRTSELVAMLRIRAAAVREPGAAGDPARSRPRRLAPRSAV